jgi:hypothetical protein
MAFKSDTFTSSSASPFLTSVLAMSGGHPRINLSLM